MKQKVTIEEFREKLSHIPDKEKYEVSDILIPDFLLYQEKSLQIYYAPHNEYCNTKAEVVLVGITPGWTQTQIAYRTAIQGIKQGKSNEQIQKECKVVARFAGSMRKNLIDMLKQLHLESNLEISSVEELFQGDHPLLHTTSLICHPVFIKGKNYTGNAPNMLMHPILKTYIDTYFVEEISRLEKQAIFIPLGKAVEEVFYYLIEQNILKEEQCLFHFPHPSGANGGRKKQFECYRGSLREQLDKMIKVKNR